MRTLTLAVIVTLAAVAPARAGSHLWRFNEVFSNADGSIMYVELLECCGAANETSIGGKDVESASTANQFFFPANLPAGTTANAHMLLATAGYAALPGVPAPDHIIPSNFFDTNGDTLSYWTYPLATMTFGPGSVPLDGLHSLNEDGTTGISSPTNFADEEGTVNLPCLAADVDGNARVNVDDLQIVIATWGTDGEGDVNGDGDVNVDDLIEIVSHWGNCS